jgi:hypothetical protein
MRTAASNALVIASPSPKGQGQLADPSVRTGLIATRRKRGFKGSACHLDGKSAYAGKAALLHFLETATREKRGTRADKQS